MDVCFGIASYKRAEDQRTLDYLHRIGIDKRDIILSVQCEEDYIAYRKAGAEKKVGKILFRPGKNVSDNRNNILDNVPAGTRIVLLDDDLNAVCRLTRGKLKAIEEKDELYAMLKRGYGLAAKHRTVGFGLYPVKNPYFMSTGYTDRSVVIGTLFAVVNTDLRFEGTTKEDYEYCCKAIRKYGAFVRLNNYACDALHYSKGGCEEFWNNKEEICKTARNLVGRYPDILKLNKKKPGEVQMIRKRQEGNK